MEDLYNGNIQRTLSLIKPDGLDYSLERSGANSLIKELPSDFVKYMKDIYDYNNLSIIEEKKEYLSEERITKHYEEFINTERFERLLNFMKKGPCIIMLIEGINAIPEVRRLHKTVRAEFLQDPVNASMNFLHAADSFDSARREIKIHFGEEFVK